VEDKAIFLLSPRSLYQTRIQDLLPPVQALDVRPARELLSDLLPVLAHMFLHSL